MLEVGERFAGCRVDAAVNNDHGRVWVFSRGNEAVVVSVGWNDYFDALSSPYGKERFLDQMAERIYESFKEHAKSINSLQANHGSE